MTLMPTVGADRPSGVRERSSPRLARLARLRTWVGWAVCAAPDSNKLEGCLAVLELLDSSLSNDQLVLLASAANNSLETCLRGAWPNHSWSIQWWDRYMDGYPIPEHWTSPKSAGGVG